jgi:hypothetical protein
MQPVAADRKMSLELEFRVIRHCRDPGTTLTWLPQSKLWIFSRPGKPKRLFITVTKYILSMDIDSIASFWHSQSSRRRYFYSEDYGMMGGFIDQRGVPQNIFSMKRGPCIFFCTIDKKWKDIYDNFESFRAQWRNRDLVQIVLDRTHSAVKCIQRWWRQWMLKSRLMLLLEFHRGVVPLLNGDCIGLIGGLL